MRKAILFGVIFGSFWCFVPSGFSEMLRTPPDYIIALISGITSGICISLLLYIFPKRNVKIFIAPLIILPISASIYGLVSPNISFIFPESEFYSRFLNMRNPFQASMEYSAYCIVPPIIFFTYPLAVLTTWLHHIFVCKSNHHLTRRWSGF